MPAYAPTIDRTTLVTGPGHFLYGASLASTLYAESIKAELVTERFPVAPAGFGTIDWRKKDENIKLSVKPIGEFNAALATLLWPYGATAVGASIYGATDVAMGVQSMAGQKLSAVCAAITKMPKLTIGAERFLVGDFEVTGILGKGLARTSAAALYALASTAWSGQPTVANFISLPAQATWALGTPETIVAKDGWEIDFNLSLDWQKNPNVGTFDALFKDLEVTASCTPMAYSESKWASLLVQSTGAAIGATSRTQADLTIAQDNPGATVVLKNAWLESVPLQYGVNQDRVGKVVWKARRSISSGYGAIFTIGVTAA
jgi:hypothetical protein